jgi:pimeloyl-ACP methyl ester carboxylesterase
MGDRRWAGAFVVLLISFAVRLSAQEPVSWHDPSPHTGQFVTVDDNVKLEVLDWGGTGRSLVLLAGLGNTAHVFDEFAPKLTSEYHVYGITRRGYGASSVPASGYSADRLGDDVLAVLDALKLSLPVLIGHSIAGEELSSIGTRHPERVAGLIYLDAAYWYAYYDRSRGNLNIDLQELLRKLNQLQPGRGPLDLKPLVQELLQTSLPEFERDLKEMRPDLQNEPQPPAPTADDRRNFLAWRAWENRVYGIALPEAELRQQRESEPDGHVGEVRTKPTIPQAIISGEEKYTDLRLPILAIVAFPHDPGPFASNDAVARAAFEAIEAAFNEPQVKAFESGVPSAHVVRLARANHYVFISNESDVLREIRAFLAGLH